MNPMSCDEAVRQFFAYLDRALSGEPMEAPNRFAADPTLTATSMRPVEPT